MPSLDVSLQIIVIFLQSSLPGHVLEPVAPLPYHRDDERVDEIAKLHTKHT
jgi:hypothetical protein